MTKVYADMLRTDEYVCNGCELRTGEKTTRKSTDPLCFTISFCVRDSSALGIARSDYVHLGHAIACLLAAFERVVLVSLWTSVDNACRSFCT